VLSKNQLYSHSFVGTLYYCSPEVCIGKPFNQKTDVWALGCILYEICTRRKAFDGVSDENLKSKIATFPHPQIPIEKYSNELN
jgi:NIMA (never in mitosis gene a)-related kinase